MTAIPIYAFGLLIRLAGALRYKLGRRLLRAYVRFNRKQPPADLFASGWLFIKRFSWFYRGRMTSGNRYRVPWQNFSFATLLGEVNRLAGRYVPPHIVENEEALLQPIADRLPTIVVTIHSGIEFSLNPIFEDHGIAYSVISVTPAVQGASRLLGLKGTVDIIPQSSDSFLIARKKLKDGILVTTCVDFSLRESGTFYHDVYIATEFFGFAKSCRAAVVYAVSMVSEDARVVTIFARPKIDEATATPQMLAADYVAFLQTVLPQQEDWKVASWGVKTASTERQFDNLCVRRPGAVRRSASL